MTVNRRLLGLTAGHLVLGIIARLLVFIELPGFFGGEHILMLPFVASVLCQALLLALWATTSRGSPWGRMAGLVGGAVYLEALFSIFGPGLKGMSTLTLTVATAALLVVRRLGVRLIRFDGRSQPALSKTEGLRFSIRGLMIVTAAVALLIAGARALREAPVNTILRMVVWAMCFVAVGLVALWAALGVGRPLWRGPLVFALSLLLVAFFDFAIGANLTAWVRLLMLMLLYLAALFGSLLIVRSCGYRFVRRVASSSNPPDSGSESLPLEIPVTEVAVPQ